MRRRVEGDGCQTNIWLVTEWLTSGHMQSSNHVYGLQKAVDDDWLICKAVWHLYLKPTPKHVPLSLSNLLRLLPCVLSYNIQIHVCLIFYYGFFFFFCAACAKYTRGVEAFLGEVSWASNTGCVSSFKSAICSKRSDTYQDQLMRDLFQLMVNVLEIQTVFFFDKLETGNTQTHGTYLWSSFSNAQILVQYMMMGANSP